MKIRLRMIPSTFVCVAVLSSLSSPGIAQQQSSRLYTVDAKTANGLKELFAYHGERLPLVSAHRGGASRGYPENCIATFEHTLRHTWSMLEIDLRCTKDDRIVLNHDPTLDRTTSGRGRVADLTLQEVKRLQLKDRAGNLTAYKMSTLDEVLEWARGKTILVLDKKDVSLKDVVRKIEAHHAEAYAMVLLYSVKDVKECYGLNHDIMMEIMVGTSNAFDDFNKTGVPWRNIVAFVGHAPPQDSGLCERIHAKGARCIAGTSRNIDQQFLNGRIVDMDEFKSDYQILLGLGVDVIETDIPREVGPLLYRGQAISAAFAKYFKSGRL